MWSSIFTIFTFFILLPSSFAGTLVPRRDTPNFYLVAVSSDQNLNLKPLRLNSADGSLTTGTPGKFFLENGGLKVDATTMPVAYIDAPSSGSSGCGTDGQFKFIYGHGGGTTNKCAKFTQFGLQSYHLNSQLGAKLVHNWTGGFYACNGGAIIKYGVNPVSGCTPVDLYTVPAVN
ncbi:hypothetical protein FRC03_003922 [Tulasnella sp. 419]|nr:hypothetical protein FRC03_003922 [Tulasnella sp. 419]